MVQRGQLRVERLNPNGIQSFSPALPMQPATLGTPAQMDETLKALNQQSPPGRKLIAQRFIAVVSNRSRSPVEHATEEVDEGVPGWRIYSGDGCRVAPRVRAEESHSGRVDSIADGEFNSHVGLARGEGVQGQARKRQG
jgi:hypothetical protein